MSRVGLLSKAVRVYMNIPPFSTKFSLYFECESLRKNSSWKNNWRHI